jgi:hypothetical protein
MLKVPASERDPKYTRREMRDQEDQKVATGGKGKGCETARRRK